MNLFLVCYDLKGPEPDYKDLYAALDKLDSARFQKSVYLVKSSDPECKSIYDQLIRHVGAEDRIAVFRVDPDAKHVGWDLVQRAKKIAASKEKSVLESALARLASLQSDGRDA